MEWPFVLLITFPSPTRHASAGPRAIGELPASGVRSFEVAYPSFPLIPKRGRQEWKWAMVEKFTLQEDPS